MSLQLRWISGAVALVIGVLAVSWMFSEAKVRRAEHAVEAARQHAKATEEITAVSENAAAEYRKKIEYLESELSAIGQIARRQDEELEKIGGDVGTARRDVERARSLRAIDATANELCAKLAGLGHPCG